MMQLLFEIVIDGQKASAATLISKESVTRKLFNRIKKVNDDDKLKPCKDFLVGVHNEATCLSLFLASFIPQSLTPI
jgi:hypothetical protein